jgi:hypothetical protein
MSFEARLTLKFQDKKSSKASQSRDLDVAVSNQLFQAEFELLGNNLDEFVRVCKQNPLRYRDGIPFVLRVVRLADVVNQGNIDHLSQLWVDATRLKPWLNPFSDHYEPTATLSVAIMKKFLDGTNEDLKILNETGDVPENERQHQFQVTVRSFKEQVCRTQSNVGMSRLSVIWCMLVALALLFSGAAFWGIWAKQVLSEFWHGLLWLALGQFLVPLNVFALFRLICFFMIQRDCRLLVTCFSNSDSKVTNIVNTIDASAIAALNFCVK